MPKKRQKKPEPAFICCTGIIDVVHEVHKRRPATRTRRGIVCPACMRIFRRTQNGVDWFNLMYAPPTIELDEALAAEFRAAKGK